MLSSIASLSRNEVIEDIQIIEGLIRGTGGMWQSSFTQRKAVKGGGGKGRRQREGSAPSHLVIEIGQPQVQQSNCKEPGLEEMALGGWEKKMRRPPHHRYLTNNFTIALK